MRKTSQDGGDTTSITSGIENEIKSKTGAAIKNKRNSIKRKVQNLGNESDDAVIEPLLQKDKEKSETELKLSAKYSISKAKTETESDKVKLLTYNNMPKTTDLPRTSESSVTKESSSHKPHIVTSPAPIHNHMNTNVFNNFHSGVGVIAPKSQILVEIDGCNQFSYDSSELIFTTAKIHTDGKTKNMEPVQVTQVPIISTIELGISKTGKVNESSNVTAIPADKKLTDKQSIIYTPTLVNNSAPSTSYKDTISNVISDSQFPSNLGKNNISINIVQKDPTLVATNFTEPQALKTTNNLENKVTKSSSIRDHKKIPMTDTLTKTTATHNNPTTANEIKASVSTSKLPCITKDTTVGTSIYTKMDDSHKINLPARKDKAVETKNMEIKTDINKNTNNLGNTSLHETDKKEISNNNAKMIVNVRESSNKDSTDKLTKNINPTIASKQLPRQKISITEDLPDTILNSKPSCSNYPTSSNTNISKDSNAKMTPPKTTPVNSTISEVKNVVKSSANNVVVSTKSSTIMTPTSPITKPSLSSTSATKPVVTTSTMPNISVITSTVTSANSAPPNNVKNKFATVTKPSASAVSTAPSSVSNSVSINREGTFNKPQTTITKPVSTTSSTVAVKASKVLNPKPDTTVSSNNSAIVKASSNSTAKSNIKTTPQTISSGKTKDNAIITSTVPSTLTKPSTSNLTNAPSSSGKSKGSSSITKTVNTTPVTSTVVKNSVPNNKNGSKSSEITKNEKGSKA